jgi:hypothetical protein
MMYAVDIDQPTISGCYVPLDVGLALMFPVKGEGVLVGLLADGEQCKLLKLHKAGDGAVDDG